eukprot:11164205-Karenia_brevis.AAC.1
MKKVLSRPTVQCCNRLVKLQLSYGNQMNNETLTTRGLRKAGSFHDPLINPIFGDMNEDFEAFTEGIAWTGVGWNKDK